MQHPDEGTIHAWIDGALSEDEAAAIERHVAECPTCVEQVAEARGMVAAASRIVSSLDVVRGNVIPASPGFQSNSLWRRLHLNPVRAALAATVLLAVGSMLAIRDGGLGGSATRRLGDSATAAAAPAAAPVVARSPAAAPMVAPAPPASVVAAAHGEATVGRGAVRAMPSPSVSNGAPQGEVAAAASAQRAAPNAQRVLTDSLAVATAHAPAVVAAAPAAEAKSAGVAGNFGAERRMMARRAEGPIASNLASVADEAIPVCYQIDRDTTSWLRVIPLRFALVRDTVTERNMVRAVSPDAKLDSIVTGSEWLATSPTAFRLVFPTAQPGERVSVLLNPNTGTAEARWGSAVRQLLARRTACGR